MEKTWEEAVHYICSKYEYATYARDYARDEILCDYEDQADEIANAIVDFMGIDDDDCHTYYYEPEEDKRNGEVDEYTGYWSVYID